MSEDYAREHAARVAAEAEADGLRRDLAVVSAERDLYRAALADAARGMVSYCGECERFATLRADEHDREFFACDHHRGAYEWAEAPHAEAIRGALRAAMGGAT